MQTILMHLSQKEKAFILFWCAFFKSTSKFEHFQKKMILIIYEFSKLRAPKIVIWWMSNKSCWRWPVHRQHGKRAETLIQSQGQHLYHIHRTLWNKLSWKKSLLVTCNVLRLFVNTLTVDDKYSLISRDNSMQNNSDAFIAKTNFFSQFLSAFFKLTSNFEHFQKKMTLIAYVLPKLRTRKTWIDKCLKSPVGDDPFICKNYKRAETLIQSPRQHLYYNHMSLWK